MPKRCGKFAPAMKKLLLAACVPMLFFASCDKEKPSMSKAQIVRVADSIAAARIRELDARAARDLEYRMKIELKGKSDSIVAANSKAQIPNSNTADSTAKVQGVNSKVQVPNPKVENSRIQVPSSKVSQ
jgi:hypothetical protein